jgi:ribosomal protein S18 acetylase RimI-like enzyme
MDQRNRSEYRVFSPSSSCRNIIDLICRGLTTSRNGGAGVSRRIGWEDGRVTQDPPVARDHDNELGHHHTHSPASGPVADASARIARPNDAAAVGLVQAAVWRAAYSKVLPQEVVDQFDPKSFAHVWRDSLNAPPSTRHVLLVSCAGEQVVGFSAVGPSADPDATGTSGEVLTLGVHPDARRNGHGSRLLNASVDTLRGKGFDSMSVWILARDEDTRAFLAAAGLSPDSAYRDRVIDVDGSIVREVRLTADLSQD